MKKQNEKKQTVKFLPTIDLWVNNGEAQRKIISGELKLQKGQWVQCGGGKKARFINVTKHGTINVIHAQGEKGITLERFKHACKNW